MKRLIAILLVISAISYSFAGTGHGKNPGENEKIVYQTFDGVKVVALQSNKNDTKFEEAIHCKVTCPDGTVYECWFCKCPTCGGNGGGQQQK